jgi:hypothetical protein
MLIAATYHYTTTPDAKVSLNFTGELRPFSPMHGTR